MDIRKSILFFVLIFSFCNISYPQGFIDFNPFDSTYKEPTNLDVTLFRSINNYRNIFSSAVIPWSDKSVLPLSITLPLGFAGLSRINKNIYDENSALLLGLTEISSAVFTLGIKYIVRRERPFVNLRYVYVNKENSPTDRYSFPSSHTTMAFSMATALTLRYPDKPVVIASSFIYAGLVAYGRIYLGVHYPSDGIGGMFAGAGSAIFIYSLRKEIFKAKNNLFRENKPDSNTNGLSAPAILGLTIGADLINNLINSTLLRNKLFISTDSQNLRAVYLF